MKKASSMHTTMLWILMAHIFVAIIAYEWLPASFRGSWIFVILLLIAGSFLSVGWALVLGLGAFISVAVYFLLDLANQTYIERQLLLLFIIPIIPVLLSAIHHNLHSSTETLQSVQSYQQKIKDDVLPLSALKSVKAELNKLLKQNMIQHYETVKVLVTNYDLIGDMLGAEVWKHTQNQMIEKLNQASDDIAFHFVNTELSEIYSIFIRKTVTDQLPQPILDLKEISTLRLKIQHQVVNTSTVRPVTHGEV